jgi:hypothetical protein
MVPFFVWCYHGGYEFVDLYWMIMQASPELVPDLLRLSLNDALTYDKVCVFSHFEGQKEVFLGSCLYLFSSPTPSLKASSLITFDTTSFCRTHKVFVTLLFVLEC